MSVYREESAHDGSIVNRGMTEDDWRRLHGRVLPNPLPLAEFKQVVMGGSLHDAYLAKELHKIMQEMRDILKEHGEFREAAQLPLAGRKADLGRAAAAAVCFLDTGRAPGASVPAVVPLSHRRLADLPRSPARVAGGLSPAGELTSSDGEGFPGVPSSPPHAQPSPMLPPPPSKGGARTLPITDHIVDSSFDPSTGSGVSPHHPTQAAEEPPRLPPFTPALTGQNRTWSPNRELIRRVALNASGHAPAECLPATTPDMEGHEESRAPPPPLPPPPPAPSTQTGAAVPVVAPTTGTKNELALLNERSSPFGQILNVLRRFQLRYGSHPVRFEIPVQYAQAVATRRLRVHLIPLRHPNVPSRWPVAKEIVVYVNDQCVTAPWRRAWPERKEEVAKTYLPLDITQYVNRTQPQQRIQIDVFNRDYFTPTLLAVVQPFSLEDVVDMLLRRELGEGDLPRLRTTLLGTPGSSGGLSERTDPIAENDARVHRFYQRVMEDDAEDGLEVDDPVVTTKCPISQMPIEVPVRGRSCGHLQCVDLTSYLVSCHKGSYWNCALCDRELRPTAITVDTVLWRYLLSAAAAGPSGLSPHLRLSVRAEAPGSSEPPLSRFFWHPSRGGSGEDADCLDDDDGGEGEAEGGGGESVGGEQVPRAMRGDGVDLAAQLSGLKRPRETDSLLQGGTADDPIEL